jgi:chromosome segregation ATPase
MRNVYETGDIHIKHTYIPDTDMREMSYSKPIAYRHSQIENLEYMLQSNMAELNETKYSLKEERLKVKTYSDPHKSALRELEALKDAYALAEDSVEEVLERNKRLVKEKDKLKARTVELEETERQKDLIRKCAFVFNHDAVSTYSQPVDLLDELDTEESGLHLVKRKELDYW